MLNIIKCLSPVLILLIGACSSHPEAEANYSLTAINSVIESRLTMGIQGYSPNHREFYSKPFVVTQNETAESEVGYRERGRATVSVLGDQRPYTIVVEVAIESAKIPKRGKPEESEYSTTRHDNRLAKKLLTNILSSLERGDKNKNVIDDFRAF